MQSVIKITDREVVLFPIILKHFSIFIVLFSRFTGFFTQTISPYLTGVGFSTYRSGKVFPTIQ